MPSRTFDQLASAKEQSVLPLEVEQNHRTFELRTKVNTLLDTFERLKLARPEEVQKYRQAAEADPTPEGREGFYQWVKDKWQESMQRLNGFQEEITQAIRSGIAGENDRLFLLQHLILTDQHDFVGEVDKIEGVLREKLQRMREDRKAYDEIKNHPLVANTGFLKTDVQTKLLIPDEKAFLALTVPERRALLKKAQEALPKAQVYAEKSGEVESKDLTDQYDKLLDDAQNNVKRKNGRMGRIIGKKTADKFRAGFKKVDRKEKECWISEFESQMERYTKLWEKIRGTLKGKSLERMEGLREPMGYTELFTEYGRVMERESRALCERYDGKLDEFHQARLISLHTKKAFSADIRKQDFVGQNRYLEFLDDQMDRYRDLRGQIDALKPQNRKAWKALDELYDSPDHGYKEIKAQYAALATGAPPWTIQSTAPQTTEDDFNTKMRSLEGIRRERVRKNVIRSEGHLGSRDQKERLVSRLDQLVRHGEQGRYDQSSYASNIQNLRRERKDRRQELGARRQEPDRSPETTSAASLRARHRGLEARDEAGVHSQAKAQDHYHVTEVNTGPQTQKAIQFEIGDQEAMGVFLHDDNIRTEGRDQVTFLARDGAEADRMTFEEVRRYRDYLKTTLYLQAS